MSTRSLLSPEEKLKIFARQCGDNAILSSALLRQWETLLRQASIARGDDARDAGEAVPQVLERLLSPVLGDEASPKPLKALRDTEKFLSDRGFRAGDIEFNACGNEAITFSIKGVPDFLVKLSVPHRVKDSVFVLRPVAKYFADPDTLLLSVVPRLGERTVPETELNETIGRSLAQKFLGHRVGPMDIMGLVAHEGLHYGDPKTSDLRALPALPGMPFIVDERAVEDMVATLEETPPRNYMVLRDAYVELQKAFSHYFTEKYGASGKCFENLAGAAAEQRPRTAAITRP